MKLYEDRITSVEELLKCKEFKENETHCIEKFGTLSEKNFWLIREHLRMILGIPNKYRALRFPELKHKLPINMFIHHSKDDPLLVAYTPDEKAGKADKQMLLKPGKFLTKYLKSVIDNEKIKTLVAAFKYEHTPPEVFFAETAKDIVWVYENGPKSCMTGKGWPEKEHPTIAYESPDIKIAYIKDGKGKRATARTVVRFDKDKPEYIRIYGDEARLRPALEALGIKIGGSLLGARLTLKTQKKNPVRIIIPYVDGGHVKCEIDKKDPRYIKFVKNGKLSADTTDGYRVHPDAFRCNACDNSHLPADKAEIIGLKSNSSGVYCHTCAKINFASVLGKDGKKVLVSDSTYFITYDTKKYLKTALTEYGLHLTGKGKIVKTETLEKCDVSNKPLTSGFLNIKLSPTEEGKIGEIDPTKAKDIYISTATGRAFMYKPRTSPHIHTLHHIASEAVRRFGSPIKQTEVRTMFDKDINNENLKMLINFVNNNYKDILST